MGRALIRKPKVLLMDEATGKKYCDLIIIIISKYRWIYRSSNIKYDKNRIQRNNCYNYWYHFSFYL